MERLVLPRCRVVVSGTFVLLLGLYTAAAPAQSGECAESHGSPGDASLSLALPNGQSVFHQGEIITLSIEYKADSSDKYIVDTASYDRSGRLSGAEIFCADPDRASDPLDDYFHSQPGIMGGGLSSVQDPSRHPLTIDVELNEWLSLPPGSYRLSIVGNRLSLGNERDTGTWRGGRIPLRSNAIEFQVEPADPGWQASQLADAIQVLDSANGSEQDKHHAARVLRFLGSEASTRELARRYGSGEAPFEWDFKFGLYGTPHRDMAVQAMKAELSDPQHPLTRDYVSTLVMLEMLLDPKQHAPAYDPQHPEEWRRASSAHWAEVERRTNQYMQQASGVARDAAAEALTASEMLQSGLPLTPGEKALWRQELVSNWSALPVEKQNELIEYRWAEVGGSEWLPVLEQIVSGPANANHAINKANRESALLRIVQTAPEEGRPLILREAAKPQGDIGIGVLGLLPERLLPQFEAAWLNQIRQDGTLDLFFQLVDRYASENTLPDLQSIYESQRGKWACVPQTAMLRYFLRVKPEYGVSELASALASRQTTGCYREQLSNVGEYARMPQVQKMAIQELDDPAPRVASDAAQALQLYGSPDARSALWSRLERFHEQWKDKPDELLHPHPGTIVSDEDSGLEQALVQSILSGHAWFADAATIRRLKELSSPAMQNMLEQTLQSLSGDEFTLHMQWWPKDELNYTLGWYSGQGMASFREKLAQFPSGSHFKMMTTKAMQEAHQAEIAEAERLASENSLFIEVEAPR